MAKKTLVAFVIYALIFSTAFVVFYPLLVDDGRVTGPVLQQVRHGEVGRANKAVHVPNTVEQRQVLGLYEDSQSLSPHRDSPLAAAVAFEPQQQIEPHQYVAVAT